MTQIGALNEASTLIILSLSNMVRGRYLNCDIRALIVRLNNNHRSEREIAHIIGCSKTAVHNAIKRYRESGSHTDRHGRGRPRISNLHQDRALYREVHKKEG